MSHWKRSPGFAALVATVAALVQPGAAKAQNVRTEDQQLLVNNGAVDDEAGREVAMDGELAAVGVPYDDHSGLTDAGAVVTYRRVAGQWVEDTTITEPTPATDNRFGWAVAMSGQKLIITAIANASTFGSAYIYSRQSGNWQLEQTLAVGASGGYGYGADISGDLAIVGSYVANSNGTATIYRYDAPGGPWSVERTLRAPDGASNDWFGLQVAIDDSSAFGEAALVAAQFHDSAGNDAGAAYVFRNPVGAPWIMEQKLTASDPVAGDAFGIGVDLARDLCVVAAWPKDDGFNDSGAAYAFRFGNGVWTEEKLTPSTLKSNGYFGSGVAVENQMIVVGSNGMSGGGSAFVFRDCGGTFYEQLELKTSGSTSLFGWDCELSGQDVIVGAIFDDNQANDAGAAYTFEIPPLALSTPPWVVQAGDSHTFACAGGPPSGIGILFLTDFNGSPFFLKLLNISFDPLGHWSYTSFVPNDPSLPGNTLGFRMLTIWPGTGLLQSNDSYFIYQ